MLRVWLYGCMLTWALCIAQNSYSQEIIDSTKLWQIETLDGNKYIGFILSVSNNKIAFRTVSIGDIKIPIHTIVRKTELYKNSKNKPIQLSENEIWLVETIHGNVFTGKITSQKIDSLQINTNELGQLTIHTNQIKRKKVIKQKQIKGGQLWTDNPQSTRYFWSPNGYGLIKGEGYYQNVWVWFNQISYGFSSNFSIGLGLMPNFLINGPTPIWITPKFSLPLIEEKINIGGGMLLGAIASTNTEIDTKNANFGIAYGVFTIGSKDANITIGSGWGMASGNWAEEPVITLSAMARLTKRGYFLTENFYLPIDNQGLLLLSFGGRTVWSKSSLDYGLFIPFVEEMGTLIAIPWLGFVIPFGNY